MIKITVFEEIEKKHNEFLDKEIKSELYYAEGYDEDDKYIGEVNGDESYCEDCVSVIEEELNSRLKEDRSELYINCCEGEEGRVTEIIMQNEGNPERDDFETCYRCGELICVGVLHTFTQEIEHYLSENLKLSELSNADCYRIHELIQNHSDAEMIEQLKEKIINENNP